MKKIIFDFDGVIHDTFELAYQINVQVLGELTREEYKDLFNGNIYESVKVTKKDSRQFFELQNEAFKSLKVNSLVKKQLTGLAKKHPLFIVSSNQEGALKTYLENNKFIHVFEEVLGAETSKSKVEKFNYLFDKYSFGADDGVFITDTLGDILEGNKVGLKTIAVDFGFHERTRLEKGNPFKIVSRFDEIIDVVADM